MIASSLFTEIQGSVCGSPDVGVADPEPQGMRDFSVGRVGPALDADRRGSRILSCGRGGVRTGPEGVGGRRRSAGGSAEWQGVHHPGDTPWSQGLLTGMGGSEPGPGHGRARARGDPSESQDRRQVRVRSRPSSQGGFNPEAQEGTSVSTTKGRKDDSPLGTGHGRRSQFQLGAVSGWGVLGL